MGMDVAVTVMVVVGVGVVVRHRKMLHYNITRVHVVARPQSGLLERAKGIRGMAGAAWDQDFGADDTRRLACA